METTKTRRAAFTLAAAGLFGAVASPAHADGELAVVDSGPPPDIQQTANPQPTSPAQAVQPAGNPIPPTATVQSAAPPPSGDANVQPPPPPPDAQSGQTVSAGAAQPQPPLSVEANPDRRELHADQARDDRSVDVVPSDGGPVEQGKTAAPAIQQASGSEVLDGGHRNDAVIQPTAPSQVLEHTGANNSVQVPASGDGVSGKPDKTAPKPAGWCVTAAVHAPAGVSVRFCPTASDRKLELGAGVGVGAELGVTYDPQPVSDHSHVDGAISASGAIVGAELGGSFAANAHNPNPQARFGIQSPLGPGAGVNLSQDGLSWDAGLTPSIDKQGGKRPASASAKRQWKLKLGGSLDWIFPLGPSDAADTRNSNRCGTASDEPCLFKGELPPSLLIFPL